MPTDAQQKAGLILGVNVVNIAKKVAEGKILTANEIAILQKAASPQPGQPTITEQCPAFAHNQSDLARILGVNRQLICHHAKRPASPGHTDDGRYSVAAWREYLAAFSRVTLGRPHSHRPQLKLDFADGAEAALEHIGERLPGLVVAALSQAGIKAKSARVEAFTLALFVQFAPIVDRMVTQWGFPSVFEVCTDGESNWPDAIQQLATKHHVNLDEPGPLTT